MNAQYATELFESAQACFREAQNIKWKHSLASNSSSQDDEDDTYYSDDRQLIVETGFKALFAALNLNPGPGMACEIQILLVQKLLEETTNLDLAESHILDGLAKLKYITGIMHPLELQLRMTYVRVLVAKQETSAVSVQLTTLRRLAEEIRRHESLSDPLIATIYYEFRFFEINMTHPGSHVQQTYFTDLQDPTRHPADVVLAASLTQLYVLLGTKSWTAALKCAKHVDVLISDDSALSSSRRISGRHLWKLALTIIFLCGGMIYDTLSDDYTGGQDMIRSFVDEYYKELNARSSSVQYPLIVAQGVRLDWFLHRETYDLCWLVLRLIFHVKSGGAKQVAETCQIISKVAERSETSQKYDHGFVQLVHVAIAYSLLWQSMGHQSYAGVHIQEVSSRNAYADPYLQLYTRYSSIVSLHRIKEFEKAVKMYRDLALEAQRLSLVDLAAVCAINAKFIKWYQDIKVSSATNKENDGLLNKDYLARLESSFPNQLINEIISKTSNNVTRLSLAIERQLQPSVLESDNDNSRQLISAVSQPTAIADGSLASALLCSYVVNPGMIDTRIGNVENQAVRKAETAESVVWIKTATKVRKTRSQASISLD